MCGHSRLLRSPGSSPDNSPEFVNNQDVQFLKRHESETLFSHVQQPHGGFEERYGTKRARFR
jgi:hypothetical protein